VSSCRAEHTLNEYKLTHFTATHSTKFSIISIFALATAKPGSAEDVAKGMPNFQQANYESYENNLKKSSETSPSNSNTNAGVGKHEHIVPTKFATEATLVDYILEGTFFHNSLKLSKAFNVEKR